MHFGNFSPYIGAGISYYIITYEPGDKLKTLVNLGRMTDPNFDVTVSGNNAFGAHAAIGIDYFMDKNIVIGIDIKHPWVWGFTNMTTKTSGGTVKETIKLDLESNILSIGVKYLF